MLERVAPSDDVWRKIASSLGAPTSSSETLAPAQAPANDTAGRPPWAQGASASSRWGWLAAAAALVSVTSLATWMTRPIQAPVSRMASGSAGAAAADSPSAAIVESIATELEAAESHYLNAISGLEQIAAADNDVLDPDLANDLRMSMALLDGAIIESRSALREEPANVPARDNLFDALRRKVALLQDTIALMNEMRKDDEVGAGRIVTS